MTEVPDRPCDAEIQAQEREVREEAESVPLVGPQVSLDVLKTQYAGNAGFLPKVESLEKRFLGLRRTRPDGNCFYRAYLFGIFEQLLGRTDRQAVFVGRTQSALEDCMKAGYERVAIEDFYDEFASCVGRIGAEGAQPTVLQEVLDEYDGYLVCWTRILTSMQLKLQRAQYEAFLSTHSSILDFCAQEVDPMATEADHLQIAALSSYLGVPVCVVYLDRSDGDAAAEHLFKDESTALQGFPTVHLLYRPGHYDIIYPR